MLTDLSDRRHELNLTGFGVVAGLMIFTAVVGLSDNNSPLDIVAISPFTVGLVVSGDLLTAYFLASQFQITRIKALGILSAAYFSVGIMQLPSLIKFVSPGSLPIANAVGALFGPWVLVVRHGLFAGLVLAYVGIQGPVPFLPANPATQNPQQLSMKRFLILLLGVFVVAVAVNSKSVVTVLLPPLVYNEPGANPTLLTMFIWWATTGLCGVSLLSLVVVTRCRTPLNASLALACLASFLDMLMVVYSPTWYTVGWYLSRVYNVIWANAVLVILLYQVTWLYDRVARLNLRLSGLAFFDELTGLANRRQLNERLESEWQRSVREQKSLALLMIDVDHFKRYNDRYGHQAGDRVLAAVAGAIKAAVLRPGDLAARYGGEEFCVILPHTSQEGAIEVASKVLEEVGSLAIPHEDSGISGVVSVSIGLAVAWPTPNLNGYDLIEAADKALYTAKSSGRNQVSLSTTDLGKIPRVFSD